MMTLQIVWFVLVAVLLAVYAMLDGFDLGVGTWHLFFKKDEERRALLNAVGPTWDGNEVWLLTGAGAIFAAFPHVYATVFSGLYLAMMLVLFALIFRAVSFEFRSKEDSPRWRRNFDIAFALGSMLPALLFGVAIGNMLRGIPLDANMHHTGTFLGLLNPYALLTGLMGFAMFALHGALFITLKTPPPMVQKAAGFAKIGWVAFVTLFVVQTIYTFVAYPHLTANFSAAPVLYIFPLLVVLSMALSGMWIFRKSFGRAFIASCTGIIMLWGVLGASLFPAMVTALDNPAHNLTIYNASSSELTLTVMLVLALLGVPVVIGYTIWAYHMFRGVVKPEHNVY